MIIFIHGYYGDTIFLKYLIAATKAMKKIENANIFIMNVGAFFDTIYYKSSTNVRILGEHIGVLLADLRNSKFKRYNIKIFLIDF